MIWTCHKKPTIFQGLGNFIFRLAWIIFSPNSRNETGITNFKEFLPETYLRIGSSEVKSASIYLLYTFILVLHFSIKHLINSFLCSSRLVDTDLYADFIVALFILSHRTHILSCQVEYFIFYCTNILLPPHFSLTNFWVFIVCFHSNTSWTCHLALTNNKVTSSKPCSPRIGTSISRKAILPYKLPE